MMIDIGGFTVEADRILYVNISDTIGRICVRPTTNYGFSLFGSNSVSTQAETAEVSIETAKQVKDAWIKYKEELPKMPTSNPFRTPAPKAAIRRKKKVR